MSDLITTMAQTATTARSGRAEWHRLVSPCCGLETVLKGGKSVCACGKGYGLRALVRKGEPCAS